MTPEGRFGLPAPAKLAEARAMPTRRAKGFTLIEVMIVVAVIAILAAIAYPSYLGQMRKGHRAAAQSYLMDLAQRQSQYLLDARAYAGDEATLGYKATPVEVAPYYKITVTAPAAVSPPTFLITADAQGDQKNDAAQLSIDNLGNKLPTNKW